MAANHVHTRLYENRLRTGTRRAGAGCGLPGGRRSCDVKLIWSCFSGCDPSKKAVRSDFAKLRKFVRKVNNTTPIMPNLSPIISTFKC